MLAIGHDRGSVGWLVSGCWLLDWRGSRVVIDREWKRGVLARYRSCFDFDHSAEYDVPGALRTIARVRKEEGDVPDRITAIAMSDTSGWERLISGKDYDEAQMLAEMVQEIQDHRGV